MDLKSIKIKCISNATAYVKENKNSNIVILQTKVLSDVLSTEKNKDWHFWLLRVCWACWVQGNRMRKEVILMHPERGSWGLFQEADDVETEYVEPDLRETEFSASQSEITLKQEGSVEPLSETDVTRTRSLLPR